MNLFRKQRTIGESRSYSGIGIHTGQEVSMRFVPAHEGAGIFFRRVDLAGKPVVPAAVEYVSGTARGTTLAVGEVKIHTVEHVLSAIKACEIDNLCIEITGIEPPAGNGSADVYVEMIESAGVTEQPADLPVAVLKEPVWLRQDDIHLVALPSDVYRVSYTLHYPTTPVLGSQYFSTEISLEKFKKEIASCRTFSLYEELSVLMEKGLIRGGSLENAVVVRGDAIISKGGLFFRDELVRHKILDLVGDLSLVGIPFVAHIIAARSGHATNCAFAKKLYEYFSSEKG